MPLVFPLVGDVGIKLEKVEPTRSTHHVVHGRIRFRSVRLPHHVVKSNQVRGEVSKVEIPPVYSRVTSKS